MNGVIRQGKDRSAEDLGRDLGNRINGLMNEWMNG